MTGEDKTQDQRGQLREEAAMWFARMRGPDADLHRAAFDDWLARGAVHRSAYNRIAEIFSAGKVLKDTPLGKTKRRANIAMRSALLATAIAIFLLAVVDVSRGSWFIAPRGATKPLQLVSLIGQIRRVSLDDGSVVTLDSNSLVTVQFERSARILRLDRGRARFEVTHDGRSFTVNAGDNRVVAHGTVFDVDFGEGGEFTVALLRGEIEVSKLEHATGQSLGRSVMLRPGQGLLRTPQMRSPKPIAIGNSPDWTRKLAVFDRAPLSDVVAAANRYSIDRIVIEDPAIAAMRVSGTFQIADTSRLCARLATLFGLSVDDTAPGVIVLRRKSPH